MRKSDTLTKRERQVYNRVVKGDSNKAIAEALGISIWTANAHVKRIAAKLGGGPGRRPRKTIFQYRYLVPQVEEGVGPVRRDVGDWVYFIQAGPTGLIKIGVSSSPQRRFEALQTASPVDLQLLGVMPGGFDMEAKLHDRFADDRRRGEWFNPSPALIRFIDENCTCEIATSSDG